MTKPSKPELIGRFCKVEWCSQFFLARQGEHLCKKCRRKAHENEGPSNNHPLHSNSVDSHSFIRSSQGVAVMSEPFIEETGKIYENGRIEIRLTLAPQHIQLIRLAERHIKLGVDIRSIEAVNCQSVIRYMIRTWRPPEGACTTQSSKKLRAIRNPDKHGPNCP